MIKNLYLATLKDRSWWAGMLQLALGIYLGMMGGLWHVHCLCWIDGFYSGLK